MSNRDELLRKIAQRKANRRTEIERMKLPYLRKQYLSKIGSDEEMRRFFGDAADTMHQYCNNPIMRPLVRRLFRHTVPWVFKKQFGLGENERSFLDSVADYCMYATSYGAWPLEIAEVTGDRVVGYFDRCPGRCEKDYELCLAVTALEPELSKKDFFAATVTFTERMPAGAPRCKVVFERK